MAKTKTKKLKNLKTRGKKDKQKENWQHTSNPATGQPHQPSQTWRKSAKKSAKRVDKLRNIFRNVRLWKKVIFLGTLSAISLWLFWRIPLPTKLSKEEVPVSTKLFDRNGKLIYEIYADKKSTPVKLDELPDYVRESTIAIEDKDFYKHYGISFTGVMRAAYKTYFGKNAKDLTLAEAALLAGLPAAPSYYSPFGARPEFSKGRQETVLKRMVEDGYITKKEADKAKDEELKYAEPEDLRAPT